MRLSEILALIPEPEQEMPCLEEVKAWLEDREDRSRPLVLGNPSGTGAARLFAMAEAEKQYREMGLLKGLEFLAG
jgi:hypothetical protein